ncbi:MAG: polysulfide reductase NrfD [Candidatus Omnitrophica bacterium]|nr:polysulfide reductase NrfD [Candidatus Omnitrophota bacterium]
MVHGSEWTVKELFVYPNEYIYWGIQIVMYPFMTGLVAGAFVLSSLYHVFARQELKRIAKFSLIFSFALLWAAPLPLLLHLQQPLRCEEVFFTPHFTSAIAAFGMVYSLYFAIVSMEIWFIYRRYFVEQAKALVGRKGWLNQARRVTYGVLTLGAWDIGHDAIEKDEKVTKILASTGIPVACFLHGYAGFIFGSVKANAMWMTPLMPVIFIVSAAVSGIALCILFYSLINLWRSKSAMPKKELDAVRMATKYLLIFLVFAISLELLDMVFRGYTAMKSWNILRSVIYEKDFLSIFLFQYFCGNLVPLIILLRKPLSMGKILTATTLILFGVFMMRWNVVIGGQAFSLSWAGFMHFELPIIPHSLETYKEGLLGALTIIMLPFLFFFALNKLIPTLEKD